MACQTANQEPISDKSNFDLIFSNVSTFFGGCFSFTTNHRNTVLAYELKLSHNSPNLVF